MPPNLAVSNCPGGPEGDILYNGSKESFKTWRTKGNINYCDNA